MADWEAIRKEYISTNIGYRELSEKHNVSFSTLQKKAKREEWPAARARIEEVCGTVPQYLEDKETLFVTKNTTEVTERVLEVATKLLDKIELTIYHVDGRKSGQAVKNCADALKTVRDILGVKSEGEYQEQRLRLEKLRKEVEAEAEDKEVTVTFTNGGDWAG